MNKLHLNEIATTNPTVEPSFLAVTFEEWTRLTIHESLHPRSGSGAIKDATSTNKLLRTVTHTMVRSI